MKFSGWLEQYQAGRELEDGPKELAGEEDGGEAEAAPTNGHAAGLNGKKPAAKGGDDDDGILPPITDGEKLELATPPGVLTEQKFTQPPPRFNEGSLVRELEKRGIGRPSTYAEIISKVQARDYVEKLPGGQMKASNLGKMIVDGLVSTELDFMDPTFTAKMEEELDEVESGKLERVALLKRFYTRFREVLERAKKQKGWKPEPEPTEFKCEEDGGIMLKRWSKNGWFLGCENYPKCKHTRDMGKDGKGPAEVKLTDIACDLCSKPMAIRTGRYGEFLSCTRLPRVQEREAGTPRREMPEVRRRHRRGALEEARRKAVLWLLDVPEVRLQGLGEAG